MTTSAVCYIIYTLTLGVLHERMVSGIGLFVVYCYMVRFLYYPFTYPCVCFLQFYYFSLSSSWVCHVHETRTVWDFVISIVLGANISGESILKHAASDAFHREQICLCCLWDLHAYNWSLSRNIHSV